MAQVVQYSGYSNTFGRVEYKHSGTCLIRIRKDKMYIIPNYTGSIVLIN